MKHCDRPNLSPMMTAASLRLSDKAKSSNSSRRMMSLQSQQQPGRESSHYSVTECFPSCSFAAVNSLNHKLFSFDYSPHALLGCDDCNCRKFLGSIGLTNIFFCSSKCHPHRLNRSILPTRQPKLPSQHLFPHDNKVLSGRQFSCCSHQCVTSSLLIVGDLPGQQVTQQTQGLSRSITSTTVFFLSCCDADPPWHLTAAEKPRWMTSSIKRKNCLLCFIVEEGQEHPFLFMCLFYRVLERNVNSKIRFSYQAVPT